VLLRLDFKPVFNYFLNEFKISHSSKFNQYAKATPIKKGEVFDIVNTNEEELVKSITESFYNHLDAEKPDSLWPVIVFSGCKTLAGKQNLAKTFTNWDLGKVNFLDTGILIFIMV